MSDSMNTRFRKITEDDLEMIMNWRMMPEITRYMYTDPKLTLDDQKRWFQKISNNKDEFYWVVETEGVPVGVANFTRWDKDASVIYTGAYIAVKEKRSMKLCADLQFGLYQFAFDVLGVNKMCQEVMGNNKDVVRIDERLGATLEGVLRQAKKKYGEYFDLYVLGILKSEWEELKKKVKYTKIDFKL